MGVFVHVRYHARVHYWGLLRFVCSLSQTVMMVDWEQVFNGKNLNLPKICNMTPQRTTKAFAASVGTCNWAGKECGCQMISYVTCRSNEYAAVKSEDVFCLFFLFLRWGL